MKLSPREIEKIMIIANKSEKAEEIAFFNCLDFMFYCPFSI